jgi:hypothetical protein
MISARAASLSLAADGPLTAREIAELMVKAKGVRDPKPDAIRALTGSASSCLQHYWGRGIVSVGDGITSAMVAAALTVCGLPIRVVTEPYREGQFSPSRPLTIRGISVPNEEKPI